MYVCPFIVAILEGNGLIYDPDSVVIRATLVGCDVWKYYEKPTGNV